VNENQEKIVLLVSGDVRCQEIHRSHPLETIGLVVAIGLDTEMGGGQSVAVFAIAE